MASFFLTNIYILLEKVDNIIIDSITHRIHGAGIYANIKGVY